MTMQPEPLYTVTVRSPDGTEVVYPLGRDQGLLVGRDETCDIVLPSDKVSRRHARFFTEGEDLHVEDLDSQSGVYVGGARLTGLNAVRPGPAIEVGEFQIRIRRKEVEQSGARDQQAGQAGTLVGTGKHKGTRIELPAKGVIGRDRSADITISDPSVSRRHAEITLSDGRLVLNDLGSSNGTFHNERQLVPGDEVALIANDIVGFGDARFRFVAGAALQASGGGGKSAIIVAALVLFIAGLVVFRQLAPGGSGTSTGMDDGGAPDFATSAIVRGEALGQEGDWEGAVKAFEEALFHDPIAGEVRVQLRAAKRELQQERLLAEVDRLARSGRPSEALDRLFTLSPESRAYVRARLLVRDLASDVGRRAQQSCTQAISARNHEEVAEHCARFLSLTCHDQAPQESVVKALNNARSRTGADEWSCPTNLAHWFTSSSASDQAALESLKEQYPAEPIRNVVVAYYRGDMDGVRRKVEALSGEQRSTADELLRRMVSVDGYYKEGSSALIGNDISRADFVFTEALKVDGELVEAPARSALATRIRTAMAQAYSRQGRDAMNQRQYTEAFRAWSRGLHYAPSDSALRAGLRELETIADEWAGQGCDGLQRAASITLPDSSVHTRVQERLERQCR